MKKTHSLILASACLLGVIGCNTFDGGPDNTDVKVLIVDPKPFDEAPLLSQEEIDASMVAINNARRSAHQCGGSTMPATTDLTWNDQLYRAAAEHNRDIVVSGIATPDHRGSGTESDYTKVIQELDHKSFLKERIENNGYSMWFHVAENVASGEDLNTSADVVADWIGNTEPCEKLMRADYKDVGLAYFAEDGGTGKRHWVMVLSHKLPAN